MAMLELDLVKWEDGQFCIENLLIHGITPLVALADLAFNHGHDAALDGKPTDYMMLGMLLAGLKETKECVERLVTESCGKKKP